MEYAKTPFAVGGTTTWIGDVASQAGCLRLLTLELGDVTCNHDSWHGLCLWMNTQQNCILWCQQHFTKYIETPPPDPRCSTILALWSVINRSPWMKECGSWSTGWQQASCEVHARCWRLQKSILHLFCSLCTLSHCWNCWCLFLFKSNV